MVKNHRVKRQIFGRLLKSSWIHHSFDGATTGFSVYSNNNANFDSSVLNSRRVNEKNCAQSSQADHQLQWSLACIYSKGNTGPLFQMFLDEKNGCRKEKLSTTYLNNHLNWYQGWCHWNPTKNSPWFERWKRVLQKDGHGSHPEISLNLKWKLSWLCCWII